jgi:hypothetical protein
MLVDGQGPHSEELAFGPQHRTWRWPGILLVGLATVALLATGWDMRQQRQEADRLLAAIEASQSTMVHAENSVVATVTYASPALVLTKTPPAVRQDLAELVEAAAAEEAAFVEAARGEVEALVLLPWHDDLERARTAYLHYLDDRAARLLAGAAGAGTTAEGAERSDQYLREARGVLISAVADDQAARVDALLAR